jgi:Outer membrane protein beta-barrel domain
MNFGTFAFISGYKKMKRIFIALLFISFQTNAQQVFNVGLKEGATISQVFGDDYGGFKKSGYVGGFFTNVKLIGPWSAGLEVLFVQKGSKHNSNPKLGDGNSYFLELNYLEIPILFKYYIGRTSIEFGPGYSFLTKQTEIITINSIQHPGTVRFKGTEFNFNIGVSRVFTSHFGLNLRYTNSLSPLRANPNLTSSTKYKDGQFNAVLALCLTYEFGKEGSIWK